MPLYMVNLQNVERDIFKEYIIESPVELTPQQTHLTARICAKELLGKLNLYAIEEAQQSAKDKVYFGVKSELDFEEVNHLLIHSIKETDHLKVYDLFNSGDRPAIFEFDPTKTLYSELEMLPTDDQDTENSEHRLRLWFADNVFSAESDGTSVTMTYQNGQLSIPSEFQALITGEMKTVMEQFIASGHKNDLSIRLRPIPEEAC